MFEASLLTLYAFTRDSLAGVALLAEIDAHPELGQRLEPHLRLAAEISSELAASGESPQAALANPRLADIGRVDLDAQGQPRNWNESAAATLGMLPSGFRDPQISRCITQAVNTFVARADVTSLMVHFETSTYHGVGLLTGRTARDSSQNRRHADGGFLLLVPSQQQLLQGLQALALDRLTSAELRVATGIAMGSSLETIAERQRVHVETVRSQLKSVFRKTGFKRQSELAAGVNQLAGLSLGLSPGSGADLPPRSAMLALPDGRTVHWYRYGSTSGRSILAFHGTLESAGVSSDQEKLLRDRGLDYIILKRPGYERTSPVADYGPEAVTEDAAALLGHLGIERCVLHGRSSGAVFALAAAKLPAVTGVVLTNATTFPRFEQAQKRDPMIVALSALLQQPRLIEAFGTIFSRTFSRQAVRRTLRRSYARREHDRRILEDAEAFDRLVESVYSIFKTCARGAADELAYFAGTRAVHDPSTSVPIHLLHGQSDEFSPVEKLYAFFGDAPNVTFEVLPDAAQLMSYTHWEEIVDALAAASRH